MCIRDRSCSLREPDQRCRNYFPVKVRTGFCWRKRRSQTGLSRDQSHSYDLYRPLLFSSWERLAAASWNRVWRTVVPGKGRRNRKPSGYLFHWKRLFFFPRVSSYILRRSDPGTVRKYFPRQRTDPCRFPVVSVWCSRQPLWHYRLWTPKDWKSCIHRHRDPQTTHPPCGIK